MSLSLALSLLSFAILSFPSCAPAGGLSYPDAPRQDVVDDYHGTKIADPYRWLEDLDSEATRNWIDAQNAITFSCLDEIPARGAIRERLTELWDYARYSKPVKCEGRYFFRRNDGLQDQPVVYVQDSLGGEPRVFLDPNRLSEDGTVAMRQFELSHDGRYVVYALSEKGSDWRTYRIRNVNTRLDLVDELHWTKFAEPAWTVDGAGFFYCRYAEPTAGAEYEEINQNMKLYYHLLGTPQSEDELIHERPDHPELGFEPEVTDDGRYLVLEVWTGSDRRNRVHIIDLHRDRKVVRLLDEFDAGYEFVGNTGSEFYFLTDLDASRKRLIAVDLENPAAEHWRELIPEADAVLQSVTIVNDHFVVHSLADVSSRLAIHDLDGRVTEHIALPTLGHVSHLSGERDDPEMFYSFASFTYPTTLYRYDFRSGESTVFRAPEIDFDPGRFEVKQVFYASQDGTRIPMFIVHHTGIRQDGSNPTYLYGYGGFNLSMEPYFSTSNLVWYEMGGVFAMPNLRGGGEYGEEWHRGGMLENKQNVFDDFIAAAEYLVSEGYTASAKLAIAGGSNGGLLTAACLIQRPDLFGAVYVSTGVLDMLRFHKYTIGWAWTSDYGCSDDPRQFEYLRAYSPLHNVRAGVRYPATLIATADHDDRVVPSHSYKFTAELQQAQAGPDPILIRVETRAGHGGGTPTSKVIRRSADRWAFFADALEIDAIPPAWHSGSN